MGDTSNDHAHMPYGWGRVEYGPAAREPWRFTPVPLPEFHQRLDRLRHEMQARDLDGVIIMGTPTDNGNIRYITNFQPFFPGGRQLAVVPVVSEPGLTTDSVMHGEPMHSGIQDAWFDDVRCAASPKTVTGDAKAATVFDHLAAFLREAGLERARLGLVEPTHELTGFLNHAFPAAEQVSADDVLVKMRKIKSENEVEALRQASYLADAAMTAFLEAVEPGVSEHELAGAAMQALYAEGAEHPSFPVAVTTGARSGFKHMAPTPTRVRDGDMVFIDIGGRYRGYYSDCSRQRVCGTPTDEQVRFMDTQVDIVEACIAQVRPGTKVADIAATGLELAREAGYESDLYFRGHGIGCSTHDLPSIAPGSPAVFEENMVFCFEPMLVRAGFGTACWEDMWRVTATGVERLNQCRVRWW